MCGIVGYVGPRDAVSVLVDGLSRLEYRGYDSAGVAVLNGGGVETRKLAGRIGGLRELLARAPLHGSCGIGHTRWATHGAPTERNAHPHADCTGTVALVHNGIIENADVLRQRLEVGGHRFVTETDTETLVHLIEESPGATLEDRVIAALQHIEGTYGIAVVAETDPGKIVVARRGSPVLLGVGNGAPPRAELDRGGLPRDSARRDRRVRHLVARRAGGPAHPRGAGGDSRIGRVRVGVSLSPPAAAPRDGHHRDLAVRRDGGYARGAAGREGGGLHRARSRERRRIHDRP